MQEVKYTDTETAQYEYTAAFNTITVGSSKNSFTIKFAATGEKLSDIEEFHPERMASRILGMGDVLSIIEKAEETISAEEAEICNWS